MTAGYFYEGGKKHDKNVFFIRTQADEKKECIFHISG